MPSIPAEENCRCLGESNLDLIRLAETTGHKFIRLVGYVANTAILDYHLFMTRDTPLPAFLRRAFPRNQILSDVVLVENGLRLQLPDLAS